MTLFLYSFPLQLCLRIWDNILAQGFSFIFRLPLAILKLCEKDLLKLDFEDTNTYFLKLRHQPNNPDAILPSAECVIKRANEITISEKKIQYYKDLFNQ
jgi:hypothetical protein